MQEEISVQSTNETIDLLLELVPADGSSIGNKTLLEVYSRQSEIAGLPHSEQLYWQIRDHLIEVGMLATGKGRGGSVYRLNVNKKNDEIENTREEDADLWAENSQSAVPIPANLEKLRSRLLDLSARNRLLNFSHNRGKRFVRVVDELPNQLFEELTNERAMRFEPVPEPTQEELVEFGFLQSNGDANNKRMPTAEEWAVRLGIKTSYELPAVSDPGDIKHEDQAIQALYFAPELESRLHVLYTESKSAIEETGANILYLALGFLEWSDLVAGNSNIRLAPLVLVPIKLERGELNRKTSTYEYKVESTGEEILTNLSLREKLKVDFGIAMPAITRGMVPEAYFELISSTVLKAKPDWKIHRFASLGLFEFGKLMMYLDLDPNRWSGNSIVDHTLVQQLTGLANVPSLNDDENGGFVSEYHIDSLQHVEENYPLIDDADSSQHSAIIDVLNGENLVIEGPPGTGKSQTITNIIAATLNQGKSVLFVAEKNAALEVVKNRLARAGLGDFCLELHSHKIQKQLVIDRIRQRINRRGSFRPPAEIQQKIESLEKFKEKLNGYVDKLHEQFQTTGLTYHQILNRARRIREEITIPLEHFHPSLSAMPLEEKVREEASFFSQFLERTANFDGGRKPFSEHPWFGVKVSELNGDARNDLVKALCDARTALGSIDDSMVVIEHELKDPLILNLPMCETEDLSIGLKNLELAHGDENWHLLSRLDSLGCQSLVNWLERADALVNHRNKLNREISSQVLDSEIQIESLSRAIALIREHVGNNNVSIEDIQAIEKKIRECLSEAPAIQIAFGRLKNTSPAVPINALSTNDDGLQQYAKLLSLLMELPEQLIKVRSELFEAEILDTLLPTLAETLQSIQTLREVVAKSFSIESLPQVQRLEDIARVLQTSSIFSWFNGTWRASRKELLSYIRPGISFKAAISALGAAIQYQSDLEALLSNSQYKKTLQSYFEGTDTHVQELIALRNWYKSVLASCGAGFGPTVWIARWLFDATSEALVPFRKEAAFHISVVRFVLDTNSLLVDKFSFDNYALKNDELLTPNGVYQKLVSDLSVALQTFTNSIRIASPDLVNCESILNQAKEWRTTRTMLEDDPFVLQNREAVGSLTLFNDDTRTMLVSLRHTAQLLNPVLALKESGLWMQRLLISDATSVNQLIKSWKQFGTELENKIGIWKLKWAKFATLAELDEDAWWCKCSGKSTKEYLTRLEYAEQNIDLLDDWLEYARFRTRLQSLGFDRVILAAEKGELASQSCEIACVGGMYDAWAKKILLEHPDLSLFSGKEQDAIRKKFSDLDHEMKSHQREQIAWRIDQRKVPAGINSGKVKERTELALLEHETSKQRRHEPVRVLMNRSSKALQALMPCFMMSPMAVAQYLPAGLVEFDLIIMDEASQVRAEEALGSFARGRQIVVVGDPKQLPPTSFFSRNGSDDEDEDPDQSVANTAESILEAAMPLFRLRRLRWHYRSRHESLIAFSNWSFYESNLVVYPSPHSESKEFGIKFVKVSRGRFVEQRNIDEAESVVKAIAQHLANSPHESLGIVSMNVKQKEQIERMLEDRSKEDSRLRELLDKNAASDEPLFIKNLENVQGDERDVIFISCTYGPIEIGGKVPQRFGPINGVNGWRRLNVLFTRSKKRMHVFSSFNSSDILVTGTSSRGVKALRDFLAFAETGRMPQITEVGRTPDSDFEVAVAKLLHKHGFECEPQLGVAGFFIDLAVRDPNRPGKYLMGIECDGASYHSAKSARDRDRLRQSILEQLGWNIKRIWSVDWFKNADIQIAPIVAELNELRQKDYVLEEPDENECIQKIVEEDDNQHQKMTVGKPNGLREQLKWFDAEVIRKSYPATSEEARLLKPSMIDALVEFMPATKWEFLERIPGYLRTGISPDEGKYLEDVLSLISEA